MLLAIRPCFLNLTGTSEFKKKIPALYAQTKATRTSAKSFFNLSRSVKWVSSILNPLDFKALNALCEASHNAFKWIKQHLRVKSFWGESENAVRIQTPVAIITYCLVAINENDLKLNRLVVEVMRIPGNSLMVKYPLQELLASFANKAYDDNDCKLHLDLNFF